MMEAKMVWAKRAVVVALLLVAIGGIMYFRAEERKAVDRERLIRIGQNFAASVYHAHAYFLLAASSSPEEHNKHIRIAGGHIMAARAAGRWLADELQRQDMFAVAGYAHYFSAVNGEAIVAYKGPGVDPELDRRIGIISENVRRLNEALNWELWTTGDRAKIQSAIDGLELLPPR